MERWDEEGHKVVDTFRLEAAALEKGTDFDLEKKTPSITRMKLDIIQLENGKILPFLNWLLQLNPSPSR